MSSLEKPAELAVYDSVPSSAPIDMSSFKIMFENKLVMYFEMPDGEFHCGENIAICFDFSEVTRAAALVRLRDFDLLHCRLLSSVRG